MFLSDIVFSYACAKENKKESRLGEAYKIARKELSKLDVELNRNQVALVNEYGKLIKLRLFEEH